MLSRIVTALVAVVLLALAASPAQARWIRAESKKFIVYSDGDEGLLRQFVSNLEDYDTILRDQFLVPQDIDTARKLEVYLVGRREDLKIVRPGIGSGIAGFYSASMDDIYFIADRPERGDTYSDDVIYHEYAHHFMHHYAPRVYPGWYVEGFAEYFGPVEMRDTSFIVGGVNQGRAHQLLNEKWISISDLLSKRPFEFKTGGEVSAYYAQAWLLTHYMKADPQRHQQLARYFAAVRPDKSVVETWTEVTGDSMEALTTKLKAYTRTSLPAVGFNRREKRKTAPSTVTTLPPSADDFILLRLRMNGGVDDEEQAAVLELARTKAAKYPGDHMAEVTLARAELAYGDLAKGRALIDGLLARNAADPEALRIIGTALVEKGQEDVANEEKLLKEARKYLARAYQADNDDYRTMYYFTRTQQLQPDYPNQNTIDVLMEAQTRAPQVAEIRLTLARAFMRHKRWDEAIVLLTPLANDPHGRGGAESAQDMLRRIKANR
jgi:tetratricopeptide (TPR) repeat protein